MFGNKLWQTDNRRGDRRDVPARVRFHSDVPPPTGVGRCHGDDDAAMDWNKATHLTNRLLNGVGNERVIDTVDCDADARIRD